MEGQLAGCQVAADEQAVPRGCGGDPRPCVPALAFGALAGGPDLPGPLAFQQRLHRLRAGHRRPAGQRDREVRGNPQHAGLAGRFQVFPQVRAGTVNLVAAGEIEPDPAGVRLREHAGGQLPLRAEYQARRQPRSQRPRRIGDLLAGDPLPGAGQRVPGALPRIRQVHRADPVRHPARAAHVLPFDAGRGTALLLLPGLVQRPRGHPARLAVPPGSAVQPGHREPAHGAHRPQGVPAGMIQQPLRPVRAAVPAEPGDAPPVTLRQVTHQRRHVLARLQPHLRPRETRAQRLQQPPPFRQHPSRAYPDGSSRLRFSCKHKQRNRQAAALYARPRRPAGQDPKCGCRTSEAAFSLVNGLHRPAGHGCAVLRAGQAGVHSGVPALLRA
jgi:hypothetical protein